MPWFTNLPSYIAAFFAGAFLANVVPHFVQGISGNPFPTPFANPPGKGLSSPLTNVLWSLINLIIGTLLFHAGQISTGSLPSLIVFFLGIALISIFSSLHFQHKHKQ